MTACDDNMCDLECPPAARSCRAQHTSSYFTMTTLKLTYFDFHGGRAEPVRLALHLGGIAFEDHRFAGTDFPAIRKTTPLGQVPVLEINGVKVTQSDAILRYAGKRAGLYPTDEFQALLCDEVLAGLEDAGLQVGKSFGLTGDALKVARTELVNGPLPKYLGWLQQQLQAHGGSYFADGRLTIADLKALVFVRNLTSGQMEHVPKDLVERLAPAVHAHAQRIAETTGVAQYYAGFKA